MISGTGEGYRPFESLSRRGRRDVQSRLALQRHVRERICTRTLDGVEESVRGVGYSELPRWLPAEGIWNNISSAVVRYFTPAVFYLLSHPPARPSARSLERGGESVCNMSGRLLVVRVPLPRGGRSGVYVFGLA